MSGININLASYCKKILRNNTKCKIFFKWIPELHECNWNIIGLCHSDWLQRFILELFWQFGSLFFRHKLTLIQITSIKFSLLKLNKIGNCYMSVIIATLEGKTTWTQNSTLPLKARTVPHRSRSQSILDWALVGCMLSILVLEFSSLQFK